MKQLGKGAMGAVYLVQDNRLSNRRAALKEMLDRSETITDRQEAINRFNREAETLAGLTHASIPHIYDRFTDEDRVYMVMEFVDGMDLEKLLYRFRDSNGGALPERVVIRHAYQLAGVLDYLHKQSPPTLHRDLKPSNMILQTSGNLKLIDFGIARIFNPGSQGTGLGTQGYAAPEQYKGMAEPRTDIYAMGATMHHVLTGRDPQLETPFDFPRLSQLTTVAPTLEDLVMAMLEMKPENRPTAGEVRRRLAELYSGIHDWEEDPRVLQVLGARPRPVTRRLNQPSTPPSPTNYAPPTPGNYAPPTPGNYAPPTPGNYAPPTPGNYAPPTPGNYAPPSAPSAPVTTPKFCTQCGVKLIPGARFCTGCGKQYPPEPQPVSNPATIAPPPPPQVSPALPSGSLELRVPVHLHGTQPMEYVAFDDAAEPACLLGVVKQNGTEYVFVCPGPSVSTGALVDVYIQRWQGDTALFEPVDRDSPTIAREVSSAWESFSTKS
ncbi:MAG: protein kinase domain-containing protein [Bacillota bacterium]